MKKLYRCRRCGYGSLQWLGRCPNCGEWDSLELVDQGATEPARPRTKPQPLAAIEPREGGRWPTGIAEFDRILGGGVISGSLVLIGGEPGVGKSTLLLQVAASLAQAHPPFIYVSGEESPAQVKLRAARLGLGASEALLIFSEQRLELIAQEVRELRPQGLIIDSIQTISPSAEKAGEPGTTRQVGLATFELSQLARELEIPIFLIGHITKSGEFAGPKAIEHLVDVVLYLEGGAESAVRLLRVVKNRYGSTEELGVFQMGEHGLEEVTNPSRLFTARAAVAKPGSVVFPAMEGTRPILVEIQALVASGRYAAAYPQRRAIGLDYNRMALLLAVIEKRLGMHIGGEDVYLNTAGGFTIRETAADLGMVAAVVSSFRNRPIDYGTVIVGEVSLAGEVRPVKRLRERLSEAEKLGYRRAVVPAGERPSGLTLELLPAEDLEGAMEVLLS
ncbi:MAG: DNA repair protein RadA [Candidatus Acetothermia bacterium]|jgi:DNA repair protein RadA/Sms|nr:DNA repair protein RadA [Candidatus Acetothermia bacterium]MDH7506077.1 DNA repair protein RadA [Candidatus Acetothermia bacterium]